MGWKDRNKKRPFGKKGGNKQNEANKGVRGTWEKKDVVKENENFEKFYKAQGIVPEAEWDDFMATLRRELPHSFRLIGCRGESKSKVLLKVLQERYFSKLEGVGEVDGYHIGPPDSIAWYPDGLGFQLNLPKQVVRKQMILHDLHTFLVAETELGHVSRQETVSMIPPLLLDVGPDSRVLDMCAAPGSKTAQLVEALHEGTLEPKGFVVANDVDNKRCYMLVHQSLKRLNNACCVVINHDASTLPNLYRTKDASGRRSGLIRYDRILCDVPCTGDGTMRKNLEVWRKWSIHDPIALHPLQLRIAQRGVELLEVGGRLVYSTCSLNPIEDEAILAQLLRWSEGALELLDVSGELPALKRSAGLSTWKIMDKQGEFYDKVEDVKEDKKGRLVPGLFPPTAEEAATMHLERSFRILPHMQNTGGFFVAVLRKTKELHGKAEPEQGSEKEASTEGNGAAAADGDSPAAKRRKPWMGHKEAGFTFLNHDNEQWKDVQRTYGLPDSFPADQLLHRSSEGLQKRNLYLVNAAVKEIIAANFDDVKIINSGLRLFGRVEQKYELSKFRLAQDGLETLFPYLSARVVELDSEDIAAVISATKDHQRRLDTMSKDANDKLGAVAEGSVCLWADVKGNRLCVCAWRGKVTIAAYIEAHVKLHILRLLGKDTAVIEGEMLSSRKKKYGHGDAAAKDGEATAKKDGEERKEEDVKIEEEDAPVSSAPMHAE